MVYTAYEQALQEPAENVEILREDQIVSPQEEVEILWARLPANPSKRHTLHAVIREWMTDCYDADEALYWIRVLKLTTPPTGVNSYEVMHRLARREFGSVRLPERAQENGRAVA